MPKKKTSTEKRPNSNPECDGLPASKKPKCMADVVQARTRSFMVVGNVGERPDSEDCEIQPLELVGTLRDAINCAYRFFVQTLPVCLLTDLFCSKAIGHCTV